MNLFPKKLHITYLYSILRFIIIIIPICNTYNHREILIYVPVDKCTVNLRISKNITIESGMQSKQDQK